MASKRRTPKQGVIQGFSKCPYCPKMRYYSRKEAQKVAKTRYSESMRPYLCPDDPEQVYWHFGHNPRWVVQGQ